jgi:ribosomal protein S18 acetylase RimI-like enzyme
MSATFAIAPARTDELASAFHLIFSYVSQEDRENRVRNALQLVQQRELDPAGVVVARGSTGLIGAMVCLPVPGASAVVWPPQSLAGPDTQAIEDELMCYAKTWLRQRGCKLAQTLLGTHETLLAAPLERNGFTHTTRLWYMRHNLGLRTTTEIGDTNLTYRSYARSDPAVFDATLLRSYEKTEDCPELNGVRTIDEILQGHRAQGVYDAERWWLASRHNQPVGVLLVAEIPEWQGWDISYVGVVPECRRAGIGRALTRFALSRARRARARQASLAVDQRNQPAWNLYRGLDFEPYDEKEVYLCFLSNNRSEL